MSYYMFWAKKRAKYPQIVCHILTNLPKLIFVVIVVPLWVVDSV